jgi:hypothetical protein
MKHLYRLLILCACLSWLPTQGQNWRPFRANGDVHAFRGASPDTILTLRLDSAAVQGSDSVYYFNRIVRREGSFGWRKALNNQFGQLMRYNQAQRTYYLLWDDGPNPMFILEKVLMLKPFAQVGETWMSLNIDYGVPTTLLSRGISLVDGVSDSVATFRVGNAPGVMVVLSKNFGLISGPENLRIGVPGPVKMLTLIRRPAPAGQSYYNPLALLNLQPGDELGYYGEPFTFGPVPCSTEQLLRRVLTRQLTADSVTYSFQQQSKTAYSNAPGCSGLGTIVSPVAVVRVSASRRTGRWVGSNFVLPVNTDLLAYEYRAQTNSFPGSVMMGHPVVTNRPGSSCGGAAVLRQERLYRRNFGPGNNIFTPGLDALGWQQLVAEGVGLVLRGEHHLTYFSRTVNGTVQTCGRRMDFGTLLLTKAARRSAAFQLYPNPAAETATITLPAPARTTTVIRVLDGVGRAVRSQQLAAGQTTAKIPVQGLTAGVYIVEVQGAGEAPQHLRLQHE